MKLILRDNGLTVALMALFAVALIGQVITGLAQYNENAMAHGEAAIGLAAYLSTGHFIEATFENWESEFLQMGAYVLLTVFLFQRGSLESKDPDDPGPVDDDPRDHVDDEGTPWPVRRGGLVLRLYENSLFLAFAALFALSFTLHAIGGAEEYSADQVAHGERPVTVVDYLGTSRFWFESFQNWQSEFLAVGGIVVFSVFLRQRGSPESKPVHAPMSETGSS